MSYNMYCALVSLVIMLDCVGSVKSVNNSLMNSSYALEVVQEFNLSQSSYESETGVHDTGFQSPSKDYTPWSNWSDTFFTDCGSTTFPVDQRIGSENTTNTFCLNISVNHSLPVIYYNPVHYSPMFVLVAVILSAVIFVFGILGNILVVVVIARTRSMHTTTNCYLLSLAVADSLVLLSATLPAIPEPFFRVDEWPYGRAMCSLLIFLQYLGVDSSSLSITAFTIERYIAICHPMRAQTMCTVSRAKRIIGVLWVFTFLYCSPWLGLTEIVEMRVLKGDPIMKCQLRLARSSYLVVYMIDLILLYVIPLIIATVLYLLIGRILYLSRALTKTDRSFSRRSPKKPIMKRADSRVQISAFRVYASWQIILSWGTIRSGLLARLGLLLGATAKRLVRRRQQLINSSLFSRAAVHCVKVVRMLVVVVVTFASLWMPYRLVVVYNSFAQHKYMDPWFLLFARTMIYVNCAINPVLYNIMSVKFKRAFRNHLNCWHRLWTAPPSSYSEVPTEIWATKKNTISHQHRQSARPVNCGPDVRQNHTAVQNNETETEKQPARVVPAIPDDEISNQLSGSDLVMAEQSV